MNAVNRPNMDSPLHLVKSVELAELLMKSGASLASQNAWFQTPLHCACKSGNAALVKCLVSSRGELDAKDQQGRTPLHYCSAGNRNVIAKCLIESGCNISELDAEGISALALAELMGFQDVAKEIRNCCSSPCCRSTFIGNACLVTLMACGFAFLFVCLCCWTFE